MFCPKCGKENMDDARFCGSCGNTMPAASSAAIQAPIYSGVAQTQSSSVKRPTGVTVIAVLLFVGAAFTLLGLLNYNAIIETYRYAIGEWAGNLTLITSIVGLAGMIYCGIGFLQLKALARKVYIWMVSINLGIALLIDLVLMSKMSGDAVGKVMIGWVIKLAVVGYILSYLSKKKELFVN